jgi:hypothetical protein
MASGVRKRATGSKARARPATGSNDRVAGADLDREIVDRYSRAGVAMIADEVPQRLDPTLRAALEPATGIDARDIRIHTGRGARRMAESLGARAFAMESGDVFFAGEQFEPTTARGRALVAHELTHVAEGHGGLAARQQGRDPDDQAETLARRVEELVLAQEAPRTREPGESPAEPVQLDLPQSGPDGDHSTGRTFLVDKEVLEEKTHQAIERILRRERERTGR